MNAAFVSLSRKEAQGRGYFKSRLNPRKLERFFCSFSSLAPPSPACRKTASPSSPFLPSHNVTRVVNLAPCLSPPNYLPEISLRPAKGFGGASTISVQCNSVESRHLMIFPSKRSKTLFQPFPKTNSGVNRVYSPSGVGHCESSEEHRGRRHNERCPAREAPP